MQQPHRSRLTIDLSGLAVRQHYGIAGRTLTVALPMTELIGRRLTGDLSVIGWAVSRLGSKPAGQ